MENEVKPTAPQNQTPSSSHSPSHDIASSHKKPNHGLKDSSRSAHSAEKSVYSTTTIKTSKTTKDNNKSPQKGLPDASIYTVAHKKHHTHNEDRHPDKHGHRHKSEAKGKGCCGGCRCHHLPPVCTVIPETYPVVMTTSAFTEGSQTLRSCFGDKNQFCQTSSSVNTYDLEFSLTSHDQKDYELHEQNGHKQKHHGQHDSSHHTQHHGFGHGHGSHGYDHHKNNTHRRPNNLPPSVYDESDISWFCCSTRSTPQSRGESVSWRSFKVPKTTDTSCSSESKVSEVTIKENTCFCKSSSTKSSSLSNRKVSKISSNCERRPCVCKKNVICCCQAQITTNNPSRQKEEHEKPPNDDGCGCTTVQKTSVSECETDQDVKYAVTKITKFDKYTTYEVLQPTSRKPKSMPKVLEGVFVLKNDAESGK